MPIGSSMTEFLEARNTGKTNIAKVLDGLFGNPSAFRNHQLFGLLNTPRAFDGSLPQDVRAFLSAWGLSEKELNHIDDWPGSQKEKIRRKLIDAIQAQANRPVQFFWKLNHGTSEETDIVDPDANGGITITFRSPWNNVFVSTDGQQVDVVVNP